MKKKDAVVVLGCVIVYLLISLLGCQMQPQTFSVTLDQQGGTGGTASLVATYGKPLPTAIVPMKSGYTFGGYYTEENGTGTKYYTAVMASARDWDKTFNMTLYAKWTKLVTRPELIAMIANGEDVTTVDTSEITDMSLLFSGASSFDQDISNWDVSSVTTMYGMFADASSFNGDISLWDVANVTNHAGFSEGTCPLLSEYHPLWR